MGFEYGYSVGNTEAIVLWEAQFGDFVNGRSRSSTSSSVPVRPSGASSPMWCCCCRTAHEGRAPTTPPGGSSGSLQLWAEGSMTIAMPSTPANFSTCCAATALDGAPPADRVHPESRCCATRPPSATCRDFTEQKFRSILEEPTYTDGDGDRSKVTRILLDQRQDLPRTPGRASRRTTARGRRDRAHRAAGSAAQAAAGHHPDEYPNARQFFWVQEEPANQGAWPTFGLEPRLLPDKLTGIKRISRRAMSAPSSASSKVHAVEQQILDEAFG